MNHMVKRIAKLFEAGHYPERGLQIEPQQISQIVQQFQAPIPITVEHLGGQWRLGELVEVWPHGEELLGRLELSTEADALLQRLGIFGLSVGLDPGCERLLELSVTEAPRVPDARIFRKQQDRIFGGEILMESTHELLHVDRQLEQWLQQGRITPAAEPFARALLEMGETMQFREGQNSVAALFSQFVSAMPQAVVFGELTPGQAAAGDGLSSTQREFLAKHWSDVPAEQIAAHLDRE